MKFRKKDLYVYAFILVISLLITGTYFKYHLVTDSYRIVGEGLESYKNLKNSEGRLFLYFLFQILQIIYKSSFSLIDYMFIYRIFLFISNILLSFGILLVYKKIIDMKKYTDKKEKIVVLGILLILFFCTYLMENLLFIENFAMILGLLFSIIASIKYVSDGKNKLIYSLLILTIGVFCYQGTINFFVPLTILFIIIKSKKTISIKELIKIMSIYIISLAINYIYVRCIGSEPRVENIDLLKSIKYIIVNFFVFSIKYGANLLVIYNIYYIFYKKNFKSILFNIIYILIFSVISCVMLTFGTTSILSPRMVFAINSIVPIALIIFFININHNKKMLNIFLIILLLILPLSVFSCVEFQKQNIESTKINEIVLGKISNVILKYEQDTNNKVVNVVFYTDKKQDRKFWGDVYSASTYSACYATWSRVYALNMYLENNLSESNEYKDFEIYKYFINNDWESFNEEQIIIKDSTVHICEF